MIYGSVYDSINESTLDCVEAYDFEESMSFQEMGAQMIEEATQDWNDYMQAIALSELSYVIENHQEYIYEAVDISSMIAKAKEWFQKLWAKIKGIAKSALAKFNSFAMNDEKFINKYESDITTGATKLPAGFSYKGYKFDGLAGKATTIGKNGKWERSNVSIPDTEGSAGALRSKHDAKDTYMNSKHQTQLLDDYRGTLVDKSGPVTSGEFGKAVKEYLYGSADKEYIRTVDANSLISIVKGAKDAIKGAKEAEEDIKKDIDEKIEALNKLEDDIKSNIDKSKDEDPTSKAGVGKRAGMEKNATVVTNTVSYLRAVETVNAQWFSKYISALKDQNRQAKALCTKLISYSNGVGVKTESVSSLLEDRFAALEF